MNESLRQRAEVARAAIEAGELRGHALRELLLSIPFRDRDFWLDTVLAIDPPPPDIELPRGSVPYLPCDVEDILALVDDGSVGPADVLVDLGSGLGRVVILGHLLSGARTLGIEIQESLVRSARCSCAALGLRDVAFTHANAAEIDLDGSVFFLYAPFNGEMLRRALERVEAVARRRPIVVGTVDLELDVPWLRPRKASSWALTLYDS